MFEEVVTTDNADKARAYFLRFEYVRIQIPSGTTSIGELAFCGCPNLRSVVIPESVRSIHDRAFYNCFNLRSVEFADGLRRIGRETFKNCINLRHFDIPSGVVSIEDRAFEGCLNLESVNIPDSVVFIGAGAFEGCTNLKSVEISSDTITVHPSAFVDCPRLKVDAPDGVEIFTYRDLKRRRSDEMIEFARKLLTRNKFAENYIGGDTDVKKRSDGHEYAVDDLENMKVPK